MHYKIRAILDVEKDVIRDVIIDANNNLEDLHQVLADAFGFNGQEMASFYKADADWNQGEEYSLFDMGTNNAMKDVQIKAALPRTGEKLIYVYDFMSMWTFFVEVSETDASSTDSVPYVSFAFGDVPEEAPEKSFSSESMNDAFGLDEDLDDDFGGFDNIDDYDF